MGEGLGQVYFTITFFSIIMLRIKRQEVLMCKFSAFSMLSFDACFSSIFSSGTWSFEKKSSGEQAERGNIV